MSLTDSSIKKIEIVLNDILTKFSTEIYNEPNKKKFNGAIKDLCGSDEDAKEILLTLVVNDVFLFVKEKEYLKVESNAQSCLKAIGCSDYEIGKVLEILKVAESIKKLQKRKKLRKLRNLGIVAVILIIPIVASIINYNSYYRTPKDVFVNSGTFKIGSNEYQLDKYFISSTEVTIEEYCSTMGISYDSSMKNLPITGISWLQAVLYCNELSKKVGLESVYKINQENNSVEADFTKNGYRLPTKTEWYWAAKGSSESDLDTYSGAKSGESNNIIYSSYSWNIENSSGKLHDVASRKANSRKIYDMSGNACEWCWDYYWDWNEPKEGIINNPTGPDNGVYRSICGGFYGNSSKYLNLIQSQTKLKPNSSEIYCGFRVARSYIKMNKKEK